MHRLSFSAVLLASGMLMAAPAFAQQGGSQGASGAQQTTGAHKQHTQTDATNTYLFKPGSGNYTPRSATKQRTDGEDVTGQNNFPAASK